MTDRTAERRSGWIARHPLLVRALLLILAVVAAVALAELILRMRGDFRIGVERTIRLREHNPGSLRHLPFEHEDAPELSGTLYTLRIDEHGFIMPGAPHPDPDLEVVFLGGSTTECLHMDEDYRFPNRVGRLLEQRLGVSVNAYNGGMAGNNSLHSIDALLNKVLPLNPNVVVMMHNINDLVILMHEGSYWNENTSRSVLETFGRYHIIRSVKNLLIPNLWEKLRSLDRRAPDEFRRVRGRRREIDRAWMSGQFEANLKVFIEICRARGVTPVLITQQNRFKTNPDPEVEAKTSLLATASGVDYATFKTLFDLFNERIRSVGSAENVLVIDLDRQIPQEREVIYGTVHLNQSGSELASEIIASELIKSDALTAAPFVSFPKRRNEPPNSSSPSLTTISKRRPSVSGPSVIDTPAAATLPARRTSSRTGSRAVRCRSGPLMVRAATGRRRLFCEVVFAPRMAVSTSTAAS